MRVKNKQKILILLAALSFICSSVFAAGFGVAGNDVNQQQASSQNNSNSQAAEIQKLLAAAQPQQSANSQPTSNQNNSSTADSQQNSADQSFGNTGVSREAFAKMVHNLMPLSPAQIKTLRKLFDQSQRAVATYPGIPPRPTSSSILVNLSPGSTPPVIRMRSGFVTSVDFIDSTGEPWAIQAYDLGDPKAFNVQWDQQSNTLLVEALDQYKSGNLAVILKGLSTPVMLTLMPGQTAVDYRVDLRVPGLGPDAKPTVNGMPGPANPELLNFLDGVPPHGANELSVSGGVGQTQAWEYKGHLFIRSRFTLISPGWISSMSSPDGTHAYELTKSPVILISAQGEEMQLTINGL